MRKPIKREGTRFVARIPDGAKTAWLPGGRLVVVHPERAAYVIEPDGTETPIVPKPDDGHGVVRGNHG